MVEETASGRPTATTWSSPCWLVAQMVHLLSAILGGLVGLLTNVDR